MSCEILIGRAETCKDSVGGLKNVYFINTVPVATFDTTPIEATDVILSATGVTQLFKFELKANENTYVETIVSDRNNGTTVFQQALNLKLKKQDATTHKYLKLLAYGLVRVVVENNAGQYFLAGLDRGMDVTGGTITSGGALVDHNGYTLTLSGEERMPAPFLNCTTQATLATLFNSATVISDNSLVD